MVLNPLSFICGDRHQSMGGHGPFGGRGSFGGERCSFGMGRGGSFEGGRGSGEGGGEFFGGGRGSFGGGRGAFGGGGPFGGGDFGFGGGGPWSFFKRGPRAKRGDIRSAILAILSEKSCNGYQIMQEMESRSRGAWRPSPGSVYPTLQQLEDEGLISGKSEGSGRVFFLTESGREYFEKHQADTEAPWESMNESGDEGVVEFLSQMKAIGIALFQIVHSGTPAQVEQAQKILAETKRGLYRILSEEGGSNEASRDDKKAE